METAETGDGSLSPQHKHLEQPQAQMFIPIQMKAGETC